MVWCTCSTLFRQSQLVALRNPCWRRSNAVGCICVRGKWKLCIGWVAGNGNWTTLPRPSVYAGIAHRDVTDFAKHYAGITNTCRHTRRVRYRRSCNMVLAATPSMSLSPITTLAFQRPSEQTRNATNDSPNHDEICKIGEICQLSILLVSSINFWNAYNGLSDSL